MKHVALSVILLIALPLFCLAQSPRPQVKFVTHATVPQDPGWYPTAWSITNVRDEAPDNTNLMLGVGHRSKGGWTEVMLQKQYAFHTQQWFVDTRFFRKLSPRTSLFVEVSPFLGKRAVYNFVRVERRVGPINLMVETENTWRRGKLPILGAGPGISLPARKLLGRMKFAPAVAWQLRHNDPDFIRVYLAFPF